MKLTGSKEVELRHMGDGEELTEAVAKQLLNGTYWHICK